MSRPKVSVLLPAYQAAATLEACLESVARQSERDFECLVVDDGSTDDTPAIAARFAARDPRFRVLSGPHLGLVGTLERGLDACRGDVVARMDADDWMRRHRLERQLAALDHADVVGTHVRLFPRSHLTEGRRRYERWLAGMASHEQVVADVFVECPIAHPTLALRRDLLSSVRYRDEGWPEDWDLVLRLFARGVRFAVVPERLLLWRDHPARLSRTAAEYRLDRFVSCRAHHLARTFLAAAERYVLWGHGETGKALRKALARHGKRAAALVEVHPRRLGQHVDGAPVVPPSEVSRVLARGTPLLVSVAGPEARQAIRGQLAGFGVREGRDYVCCA